MSGFPLSSFHSAETSLFAFPWLYALLCAVVQKYHKCLLYLFTFLVLILQSTCFIRTTWKTSTKTSTESCMWTNESKIKTKPSHVTFKLTTRSVAQFSPQTMQDWTSRTLANPPLPYVRSHPIFVLSPHPHTHPPPIFKVDVICVSPLA